MKRLSITVGVCSLVLFAVCSRAISMEDAAAHHELLDGVISEHIAIGTNALRQFYVLVSLAEMTDEGSARIDTLTRIVNAEIVYLRVLKTNGPVSTKQAYCIMVLEQELSELSLQLRCKNASDAQLEALPMFLQLMHKNASDTRLEIRPKIQGRSLTDAEREAMKLRVKERTELKKKIEGITPPRTVP